jgi:toxin HigB-1
LIKSFKDRETERLYISGKSSKFPASIINVTIRKFDYLDAATCLSDLASPPGNRLEALKGIYKGKYSIRINDQYRIIFRYENMNAYDVEIIDYH